MRKVASSLLKLFVMFLAITVGCAAAEARRVKKKTPRPRLNMPPHWTWPPNTQMKADGRVCLRRLTQLGVDWARGPATRKIATPIVLPSMEIGGIKLTSIWRKGPFPMDCFLALAFAERGSAALREVGVRELRFAGIHDYRTVAGKNVLSRHALGLAMDVFELVDDEGERHVVKTDYRAGDGLLWDAEDAINDTGAFRMLLTPGNDPQHHYDHYHFEARTSTEAVEPALRVMARPLDRSLSP